MNILIQNDTLETELSTINTDSYLSKALDRADYFLENEWDIFVGNVSLTIIITGTALMFYSLYQIDLNNDVVNNLQRAALGFLSIPFGVVLIGYNSEEE